MIVNDWMNDENMDGMDIWMNEGMEKIRKKYVFVVLLVDTTQSDLTHTCVKLSMS